MSIELLGVLIAATPIGLCLIWTLVFREPLYDYHDDNVFIGGGMLLGGILQCCSSDTVFHVLGAWDILLGLFLLREWWNRGGGRKKLAEKLRGYKARAALARIAVPVGRG